MQYVYRIIAVIFIVAAPVVWAHRYVEAIGIVRGIVWGGSSPLSSILKSVPASVVGVVSVGPVIATLERPSVTVPTEFVARAGSSRSFAMMLVSVKLSGTR